MQKYKINRSRHAAFLLHVHLVFVTKYRRKILGELHCAAFHQYAAEVCRDFGAELKESNGDVDHVHMLIEYPPTVQLSVLVNSLKAVTSRRLRNEFLDLRGAYGCEGISMCKKQKKEQQQHIPGGILLSVSACNCGYDRNNKKE